MLGGARGTNEDAYVWARFAKGVLGTDNVDAQLGDGLPAEVVLGLPRADDRRPATAPRRSSLLGPDLKEELPVLYLRVKRAADELGVPLVELAPGPRAHRVRGRLDPRHCRASGRHRDAAGRRGRSAARRRVRPGRPTRPRCSTGRDGDIVVVLGRGDRWPSRPRRDPCRGARLPRLPGRQVPRRAAPRQRARRARPRPRARVPARTGHARRRPRVVHRRVGRRSRRAAGSTPPASCDAAAAGPDPRARAARRRPARTTSPTAALRRARARRRAASSIAIDAFITDSTKRADVFLPVTMWGEKAGSVTNLEGRVQRVGQKVSPGRHADGRLADRRRARAATRRRLRPRAPSRRSRTRSPASRRRTRASTPRCCAAPATASVAPDLASTPTSSSSARSRSRSPTRRGSRSARASTPSSSRPRRRRRRRSRRAWPPTGSRRWPQTVERTGRSPSCTGGAGDAGARRAAPPRRVRSPPRDGTHALRRRDHGGGVRVPRRARRRSRCC